MKPADTLLFLLVLTLLSTPRLKDVTADGRSESQSKQTLPGKMVFDDKENKFTIFAGDEGKSPFDHAQHVKAEKDSCVICHHTNSETLTKALEKPVAKCSACHKAEDETCAVEGTREGQVFKGKTAMKSKEAFHGRKSLIGCIGCHKQRNEENREQIESKRQRALIVGCDECHKK